MKESTLRKSPLADETIFIFGWQGAWGVEHGGGFFKNTFSHESFQHFPISDFQFFQRPVSLHRG
jgi:hypothetical protein